MPFARCQAILETSCEKGDLDATLVPILISLTGQAAALEAAMI
jgi:hypothetical protein